MKTVDIYTNWKGGDPSSVSVSLSANKYRYFSRLATEGGNDEKREVRAPDESVHRKSDREREL